MDVVISDVDPGNSTGVGRCPRLIHNLNAALFRQLTCTNTFSALTERPNRKDPGLGRRGSTGSGLAAAPNTAPLFWGVSTPNTVKLTGADGKFEATLTNCALRTDGFCRSSHRRNFVPRIRIREKQVCVQGRTRCVGSPFIDVPFHGAGGVDMRDVARGDGRFDSGLGGLDV
jgi:hypothetical protein